MAELVDLLARLLFFVVLLVIVLGCCLRCHDELNTCFAFPTALDAFRGRLESARECARNWWSWWWSGCSSEDGDANHTTTTVEDVRDVQRSLWAPVTRAVNVMLGGGVSPQNANALRRSSWYARRYGIQRQQPCSFTSFFRGASENRGVVMELAEWSR